MGNGPILNMPPRVSHTVPRVSDIAPALPYAVFLQNTLILYDVVPRVMP